MTADTITAIKKALEGVTPGPWHVAETGLGNKLRSPTVYHAGDDLNYVASFADFMTFNGPTRNLENARYIAAVNPAAITDILSEIDRLQRENAELREDRDRTARNRDIWKGQVERQEAQIEDFRSEAKRLQVGVFVETLPAVHLISVFADDMNERNWDDKRAYIKQQAERIRTALSAQVQDVAGWRLIETADKNASQLLLGIVRREVLEETHVGGYRWAVNEDDVSCWWSDQADDEIVPTHWMPLPASPASKHGDAE